MRRQSCKRGSGAAPARCAAALRPALRRTAPATAPIPSPRRRPRLATSVRPGRGRATAEEREMQLDPLCPGAPASRPNGSLPGLAPVPPGPPSEPQRRNAVRSPFEENDGGSRAFQILHRRLQRLCRGLRPLRGRVPGREGRRKDGALRPARHRLRGDLPACGRHHGARQRARGGRVRALRGDLRRVRAGMREAFDGALPGLRQGLPPLRRGVPADGCRGAARARSSGPALRLTERGRSRCRSAGAGL